MYQTVKHLIEEGIPAGDLFWLRLDHPLLLQFTLGDLVNAVFRVGDYAPEHPAYVFLDELVYTENWDLWLKTFYDEHYPIRVVATSSATAAIKKRRTETGVGRWEEQYLRPYLFTEFLALMGVSNRIPVGHSLWETIDNCMSCKFDQEYLATLRRYRRLFVIVGGFPELLTRQDLGSDEVSILIESQQHLRADAIERAIYKDIPQAFQVDRPMLLERLLYVLAGQVTGILSPTSICQELNQLSQPTFDRYLSYFERAFVVFTLPNYSGREMTVQKRGRKLYFVDGAIRNAALQRGAAPLDNESEMGVLLENLAASQFNVLASLTSDRLFHWRDGKDEVDLIYNHPDRPMAFEIASSSDHSRKGLVALAEKHPRFQNRCYLVAPDAGCFRPEETQSGIGTLPFDILLLAVGLQAQAALADRLGPDFFVSPPE